MRYVQLRAFHYVAIHGGFSRAGEALRLTQPAISDQVRRLETEYDIRLFDRGKRQITLTSAGMRLLDITHRLFEVEQQAFEFLNGTRTAKDGQLRIIADAAHHLLHILALFRQEYPDVHVTIRVGNSKEVAECLNNYDADVGIIGEVPTSRTFKVLNLGSTPLVAFCAKDDPLATCAGLPFKDLVALPLVMREKGSRTRAKLEETAAEAQLCLNMTIEAEGREAVREIVASGAGIGVVSEAEFGDDPRLVKIPIRGADLFMDEALVCLRERYSNKLIEAFMTLAKDHVRKPSR